MPNPQNSLKLPLITVVTDPSLVAVIMFEKWKHVTSKCYLYGNFVSGFVVIPGCRHSAITNILVSYILKFNEY